MLILPLSPQPSTNFEFILSSTGQAVSGSGQAAAGQLPKGANEVVAVVPWQVMSWHRVTLPPGIGSRLSAVLPNLLEEQLLQDTKDLHCVLAPDAALAIRQGGPVTVAVCAKAWLRQVLAPLQAAGIQVQRIVPELSPSVPPELHVLNDNGNLQVLLCQGETVWRLPAQPSVAASVAGALPDSVWAEPSMADQAQRWSHLDPRLQSAEQRCLRAVQSSWDLAQGEWAHNSRVRGQRWLQQTWRVLWHGMAWQSARRGLLALLVVQLVGLNAWAWREQSLIAMQQAELTRMLKDSFPKVSVVVDAPAQMRREVQALQQGAGLPQPQDLDAMLQAVSAHWPDNRIPNNIDYRAGELRMGELTAADLQALSQVPWSALGYQWRSEGQQGILRAEAKR
jgi:general secretion pathway protein L